MTKEEKREYQKLSRKCRFCLVSSIALVALCSLAKIIYSNRSATWGRNLESLQSAAAAIRQENLVLQSEMTKKAGGLTALNQEALERGFTDKPQIRYISHDGKLALKAD